MTQSQINVAILGGSALATPKLFETMGKLGAKAAYDFKLSGRDVQRLDLVCRVSQDIISSFPHLDITVKAAPRLEDCLEGADYVVNQVRVGGLEGRAFDETFPRQFGIPGEETVGPGGFTNSMRGIPVTLDICRTVEKLAPHSLMLNLTNPSSIIQYAIRRYTRVRVFGTCDSPVSLMEMVAAVLKAPLKELTFEIGGMHHFGWISGVRQDERQRLPEVLARAAEMPKLGVDPELIQALGVIPSFYAKYYFHPDRILAATQGRKIRAHELMELSDTILEAYRRWQPGQPPVMVNQRGAVWYEKIVVPALLALAEKQTTQMVLSVDNQGALPWLPPGAIIEAMVPIQSGIPQAPIPAPMPQDIKAMIAQNCAYEMLAAEAIAENDRGKALRALQANLLVKSFNTARGILQQVWPSETRYVPKTFVPSNGKLIGDTLKIPTLHFGDRLVEGFKLSESSYALVTMEEPWELIKDRLKNLPDIVYFVRELDWYKLEAMERSLPDVEALVAVGGGTPTDAAKYLAWRRRLPVDVFPSITSVDAAVTKSVAARAGGHVTYIGYIVPRHVYVDYRLIQGAPPRLNISGVGDILCAHTALWDWRLARTAINERYDSAAVAAMQIWLGRILSEADQIRQVSQEGIQLIMEAFAEISIICRKYGSSRPQEASDHTFAYNAEFQTGKSFLHGELVGLGTYVLAKLQDNNPEFLLEAYQRTGLLWQPADIGLTREEFIRTLQSLNWYQKNFGRRYSILNQKTIDQRFIDLMLDQLNF